MAYALNSLSDGAAAEIGVCDATNPLSKSSLLCIRNGKLYCNGEQVGTFNTWSAVSGTPVYNYFSPVYAYGIANGRLFQLSISDGGQITATPISGYSDWVDVIGVSYDTYGSGLTGIEGSYHTCAAFGIRTGGKLYSLLGSSVKRVYLSNLTTAASGFTCVTGGHITATTVTRVEVETDSSTGEDSGEDSSGGAGFEIEEPEPEYVWQVTRTDGYISFGISDGKLYGLVLGTDYSTIIAVQVGSMSTWTAVAGGYVYANGVIGNSSVFGIAGGKLYHVTGQKSTSGWTFTASQEGSLSTWTAISNERSMSYPVTANSNPFRGIAGGCLYLVIKDDVTQIGALDTWTAVAGDYGIADGLLYAISGTGVTRIGTFGDWLRVGAYYAIRGRSDSDGSNGGTLWVQGKNGNYELGLGHRDTPVKTLSKSGDGLDEWVSGAFCRAAMILINKSGEMWGVGNNMSYQLGQNPSKVDTDFTGFVRIGSASNWVKVCGDSGATFALNTSGQIWYWTTSTGAGGELATEEEYIDFQTGLNGKGLAVKADGTLQYINNGVYPVSFTDMTIEDGAANFVKCATIGGSSAPALMALTADGKIYTATSWSGTFVKLESDQVWKEIACGRSSFYAINSAGELYAWSTGDGLGNRYGQLGLGDTEEHTTPEKVGSASNWKIIQAGQYKLHAINVDGKLYSAGSVSYGLGLNSTATQTTLRQVPLDNCALCTIQGTGWNSDSFGVIVLDSVPPTAEGGAPAGSVSGCRLGSSVPVSGQKGLLVNGQYFIPLVEAAETGGTGLLLNGFWIGSSVPGAGQKGLLVNGEFFIPFAAPPASVLNDDTVKFLLCPSMSGGAITDIASAGNGIALINTGSVAVTGNNAMLFGDGKKLTIPANTLPDDVFVSGSPFLIEFQCLIPADTEKTSCAFARDFGTSASARLDMYLNTISGDASYGDISIGYWTNSVTRPKNFTVGQTHVIAFEFDGSNTNRVYLDGAMQYSFTGTSYLPFRTLDFHIGNDNDGIGTTAENPFYGSMSYFRIRNVAPYQGANYTPELI